MTYSKDKNIVSKLKDCYKDCNEVFLNNPKNYYIYSFDNYDDVITSI